MVELPESLTYIGQNAFTLCNGLKEVKIKKNVKTIVPMAFSQCEKLEKFFIDKENEDYASIDGNIFTKDGSEIVAYASGNLRTEYTMPDTVKKVGDYAFLNCVKLEKIVFSNSLEEICNGAFLGCFGLKEIKLPNSLDTIGEGAFSDCINLTKIEIPKSVTTVSSYAFYGCLQLKKIKIPSSVTAIGEYAFGYNYNESAELNEVISGVIVDAPIGSAGYNYAVDNKLQLAKDVNSNKGVRIIAIIMVLVIIAIVAVIIYFKKRSEKELLGDMVESSIIDDEDDDDFDFDDYL